MNVRGRRRTIQKLISCRPYDESDFAKYCRRERLKAMYETCIELSGNMELFNNYLDGTKVCELKEIISWDEQEDKEHGKPFRKAISKYLRSII